MHTIAILAVALPMLMCSIGFLYILTDGFKEWLGVVVVTTIFALVVSFGWGANYLQKEAKAKAKASMQAENPK